MRHQRVLLIALVIWTLFSAVINSFSFPPSIKTFSGESYRQAKCSLNMALTPVGPFCPFRSTAAQDMDPRMDKIAAMADSDFATEMSRMQLDMQMGREPDPARMMKIADGLEASVEIWEGLITRLRISQDFQTREYAKLTQAMFSNHGVTFESMSSMVKWQSKCMRAMATNGMPPMPPPDLDLSKMMESASEYANSDNPRPSMSAMAQAAPITSDPFEGNEEIFNSPQVKKEYENLCRDHMGLIEFGTKYETFDPLGKLRFLDEIEQIEERWDVFMARFSLMGALNKEFVRQCNEFLETMGMDEQKYRELLKKCHQMMRDDAEAERNKMGQSNQ